MSKRTTKRKENRREKKMLQNAKLLIYNILYIRRTQLIHPLWCKAIKWKLGIRDKR